MRFLVLGGTVFLGRAIVEAALAHGHDVTLFNRGRHNPELFAEVENIRGDRAQDLTALQGREWDAVIDTSGYVPRVVRNSAEMLSSAERYVFISTLSVYCDLSTAGQDESGEVGTLEDASTEEVTGESYGPLKALCERAVEQVFKDRAISIRAGLIVGPHDQSDRFTYWPARVADGGEILAPAPPEALVQFIDVRDLASWSLRMAESGMGGVYNATGPDHPLTFGELLKQCQEISGVASHVTWADADFLLGAGVEPWSQLPLWIGDSPEMSGFSTFSSARAISSGLTYRPLSETVRDTLEWYREDRDWPDWRAGISREREAELLRAWHAANRNSASGVLSS